ncbi:helix-turn-helix domain-containing protein [Fulvivirga ulvae]|uniref:winged helix-turn-helix domain-containing protein n=1 Tax=Fulvivirga ulvae TaxID=2904245 RepID=UPI001F2CC7CE|nr:helix-turn-helix domain-containing protein [Fulvivirga ulvae]UII32862.1 helix-turn-helix domain-containing protein [Fulvivirga ulvae]
MEELENQFSQIAALIGDKARSVMLWNLLDGRAYTATELSLCANISPQSASNHLAKLVDANILTGQAQILYL